MRLLTAALTLSLLSLGVIVSKANKLVKHPNVTSSNPVFVPKEAQYCWPCDQCKAGRSPYRSGKLVSVTACDKICKRCPAEVVIARNLRVTGSYLGLGGGGGGGGGGLPTCACLPITEDVGAGSTNHVAPRTYLPCNVPNKVVFITPTADNQGYVLPTLADTPGLTRGQICMICSTLDNYVLPSWWAFIYQDNNKAVEEEQLNDNKCREYIWNGVQWGRQF